TGQFVGRSPDVHAGVVEDEVVEVDERALEPQTGAGVGEVSPGDEAGADRALGKALVEPSQCILGCGERASDGRPGQRIGDLVAGWQGLDNLSGNRRSGSYHDIRFRHSDASRLTRNTIDNYPLSIVSQQD